MRRVARPAATCPTHAARLGLRRHKLIVRDADVCPASDYGFLPFGFTTAASGANAQRGKFLEIAESSALGSESGYAAHHIDVAAYLRSTDQQIGDADVVKTDDPHWCGHMLAATRTSSGWVHAYARLGRGLVIYDGFDRDDLQGNAAPARCRARVCVTRRSAAAVPRAGAFAARALSFDDQTFKAAQSRHHHGAAASRLAFRASV